MIYLEIDEIGIYKEIHDLKEQPMMIKEGVMVPNDRFVNTLFNGGVYVDAGKSPIWINDDWVSIGEIPKPDLNVPSIEERLEIAELVLIELMML